MQILGKISWRLGILIILFFGMNWLYESVWYKGDVAKHADTLENVWALPNKKLDYIYFGESSNFHTPEGERKKYRISYLLDDLLPHQTVGTVDNAGLHSGTYLALIQNLNPENLPKALIVTVNLRSFGQVWQNSEFETNLSKLERLIQPGPKLLNRFLVSLNAYDCKTNVQRQEDLLLAFEADTFQLSGIAYQNIAAWDKAIAWGEWNTNTKSITPDKIPLACHYVKNFAFRIRPDNPRITDLDKIVNWGKQNRVGVIFHILADNLTECQNLMGDELTNLILWNASYLEERYTKAGVLVINNIRAVPDEHFVDRNWPTEHYDYTGKKIIAEHIANAIR